MGGDREREIHAFSTGNGCLKPPRTSNSRPEAGDLGGEDWRVSSFVPDERASAITGIGGDEISPSWAVSWTTLASSTSSKRELIRGVSDMSTCKHFSFLRLPLRG